MASLDLEVTLELVGVGAVTGRLERVATGWCLLRGHGQDWVVRIDGDRRRARCLGAIGARGGVVTGRPARARLGAAPAGRQRASPAASTCSTAAATTACSARRPGLRRGGHRRGRPVVLVSFAQLAAVQSRR